MKRIVIYMIAFSSLALVSESIQAQAWERNSRVISLGIGASHFFHMNPNDGENNGNGRNWYNPVTFQLNIQGEFGVHEYVGLGFTTGMGGRGNYSHEHRGEFNIPIGMVANFHFYELIAHNREKDIHSDKLDIYAGASVGSGLAFAYYDDGNGVDALAFGGLHVGIRYYFNPRVGVNGEFGWGKSIVNVGVVFKPSRD